MIVKKIDYKWLKDFKPGTLIRYNGFFYNIIRINSCSCKYHYGLDVKISKINKDNFKFCDRLYVSRHNYKDYDIYISNDYDY